MTLQPIPYVSFNVRSASTTLAALKKSRNFVASVIDEPFIADAFAQQVPESEKVRDRALKLDGRLKEGMGGVIWLQCRYVRSRSVVVGDHDIVVGEVLDFGTYKSKSFAEAALVYSQGRYKQVTHNSGVPLGSTTDIDLKGVGGNPRVFRKVPWPPFKKIEL